MDVRISLGGRSWNMGERRNSSQRHARTGGESDFDSLPLCTVLYEQQVTRPAYRMLLRSTLVLEGQGLKTHTRRLE